MSSGSDPKPKTVGWPRSAVMLALGGLGIALAVTTAIVMFALNLRDRAIDDKLAMLANDVATLSDHVDNAFQAIETVQGGVIEQMNSLNITTKELYARAMVSAERHQSLKDRVTALPFANAVALLDRGGSLLNWSRSWPIPDVNFAERDFFKALSPANAPKRVISAPMQDRASGAWTVSFGHRFTAPNGTFLGIVLGTIDLSHVQREFAMVTPEADMIASLVRNDGMVLARRPAMDGVIGVLPASGAPQSLGSTADAATIRTIGQVDGQDRVIVSHRLAHYPIAVSLSQPVSTTLANWRQQTHYLFGVAALLNAGLAGMVLIGVRHLTSNHRLAAVEASLAKSEVDRATAEANERAERALSAYYERFNIAVYTMSQGLAMFDTANRLTVSNSSFGKIFGLAPQNLTVGTPLARAIRTAIRQGTLSVADVRRIKQELRAHPGFPIHAAAIWDIANGCAFSVDFRRMTTKGWLVTFEDITERRRTDAQIAHMAHHDALTGLPNRILFRERLVNAVRLAERGIQQGILCLDLDHFKDVNDTLGHPVGDALLQAVTGRLLRCVRETDTVARLGGDEFAIILSSVNQVRDVDVLTDRLIEELCMPFDIVGHQVVIGVSIGVALTPDDGVDPDMLLKNADLALYQSKADGRGCCRYFKPEMDALSQARRQNELDLRRAVTQGEFELYYQPLVHIGTRTVCGFEALVHWCPPDRPPVSPSDFIPVAEGIGLIVPLGAWVLETACQEATSWPNALTVAVNLSPVQFKGRGLVAMVQAALDKTGLSPRRLELEITESVLLQDTEETLSILHQLRGLGVRISMDDFGTGYSSLSYLLKFPFDKVKIDQSFMADLGHGGVSDAIVRAITGMCLDLKMQTIAEGVETHQQLAVLRQLNCTEVQGFLFSPAVPASRIATLLTSFEPRDSTLVAVD